MNLRQIPALRPQLLPDIRDCINADNINSPVRQIKEIVHHFIEYSGVSIIQIPLIRIKRSHHKMPGVGKPCEITRSSRRKYLRHRLLIFIRFLPIIKEEITAHILPVSLACLLCPFMLLRRMVHHKVHTDMDTPFMAGRSQASQILHGAKLFLHLPKIRHGISSVRSPFRRFEKRHQMNIIHIALLNIIQPRLHAFHISRKVVNIEHHAQHVILLIPVRICRPCQIQCFEFLIPLHIETSQIIAQLCKH